MNRWKNKKRFQNYPKNNPYAIEFKSGRLYEMQKIKVQTSTWKIDLQNFVSNSSDIPTKLNNTCLKLNHDFCWKKSALNTCIFETRRNF